MKTLEQLKADYIAAWQALNKAQIDAYKKMQAKLNPNK